MNGARTLRTDQLRPHPANIRGTAGDVVELASSIRSVGLLQPLVVMPAPALPGVYVVLAGYRRLAAAKLLGLRELPCMVRTDTASIEAQLVTMLVENVQRADLGPVEKAEAFGELRSRGMTLGKIAARVGLSEGTVSYFLALLDLDRGSLQRVRDGRIGVGDAIDAVRQTRREERRRDGYRQTGRPAVVEAQHFTTRHPLAAALAGVCDHSTRPKVGKVACGGCWEAAIRADERGRGEPPDAGRIPRVSG